MSDFVADLYVEFLYMWVRRGRGAESVSFNDEPFDDFNEVGRHVRDVISVDVVHCWGV